jgi:AhpD family alkylhydroperoxidase
MNPAKQVLDELHQPVRDLPERIPGVFDGYGAISTAVLADGALGAKTEELIAPANAIVKQNDGCIAAHGDGATGCRATGIEVTEALGMALMMNGGPGTVHTPRAFAAFEEFATKP